jgi:hypothetical protein
MAYPTAAIVRSKSKVDFDALGFGTDPELQDLVDAAMGLLGRFTGQSWDPIGGGYSGLPPAVGTEGLALQALIRLTEVSAYRAQEDVVETMGDFDLISSFSAGSYSETRRGGKDAQDANIAMWRALFWPLMTYDAMDDWESMTTGVNAPAFGVTEVDWQSSYGASVWLGGTPDDPYPFTTD